MPEGILDVRGGVSRDSLSVEAATAGARISGTVSDANGPLAGALVAGFPEGRHANALRLMTQSQEPEAVAQYDRKLETLELSEGDAIVKDLKLIAGR